MQFDYVYTTFCQWGWSTTNWYAVVDFIFPFLPLSRNLRKQDLKGGCHWRQGSFVVRWKVGSGYVAQNMFVGRKLFNGVELRRKPLVKRGTLGF